MTISILQQEIDEQPAAVERFLADQSATADRLVNDLKGMPSSTC